MIVTFNRTDVVKSYEPIHLSNKEFDFLLWMCENGLLDNNIEFSYYDEIKENA